MACNLNLFSGDGSVEDVWDDTELIHHFDLALETSRKLRKTDEVLEADKPGPWKEVFDGEQELEKLTQGRKPMVLNSQNSNQLISHQWQVGSTCRTIYSEDNVEYEAKIVEVSEDICIVRFVGYGNEEEVQISSLKPSLGKQARDLQRIQALQLVSLGTEEIGHEEVPEESTENEKPSTSTSTAHKEEDPEKYDELRDRVRQIIQERCRASQELQEEDENLTPEAQPVVEQFDYQHHRFPQLNPRRKCRRKCNLEGVQTNFSTISEGRATAAPDNKPCPKIQNSPSASNPSSQEWTQAFPNLFMPPLPGSLANNDGKFNFGKGQLPALLMSWYMAGYHAGAFDARRDFQKSKMQ